MSTKKKPNGIGGGNPSIPKAPRAPRKARAFPLGEEVELPSGIQFGPTTRKSIYDEELDRIVTASGAGMAVAYVPEIKPLLTKRAKARNLTLLFARSGEKLLVTLGKPEEAKEPNAPIPYDQTPPADPKLFSEA